MIKKNRVLIFLVSVIFIFIVSSFSLSSAHEFHSGDNVNISSGQNIENTIFTAGRNVEISSEINGDVFCAAQTVTISSDIHGDLICAAQTITINGNIDGDIRIAGQTLNVNGKIDGSASVAGQTFNLSSDGSIGRDISLGVDSAVINGEIGRDIAVGGSTVTISSKVGRDIKGNLNNLKLQASADILGNIDYTSVNEIEREIGANVSGQVSRNIPAETSGSNGFNFGWFMYVLLSMLFTSFVLVLLFPEYFNRLTAISRPWRPLIIGFVASILMPIIIVAIMITIIGLPLAMVLLFSWFGVLILSGTISSFYVGRWVLKNSRNSILVMLVGSVILSIIYFIPYLGFILLLFAHWLGFGLLLINLRSKLLKPDYKLSKIKNSKN